MKYISFFVFKGLWDEKDGFYYDVLKTPTCTVPLRIRSMVGLIPLYASLTLDEEVIEKLPGFKKRLDWFMKHRPDLSSHVSKVKPAFIATTFTEKPPSCHVH